MEIPAQVRTPLRWIGATLAAVLTTALLTWLNVGPTTAGMLFLVVVVWTATREGLWLSIYSAVLCALLFDYYFLPPVHTFTLAGPREWVGLFAFVASSVVAGRVAERARMQAHQAEQRREDVERLYTMSQELMLYEDSEGLMRDLPRMLRRIFGLENVALYVRDEDKMFGSTEEMPETLQASLSTLVHGPGPVEIVPGSLEAMPLMLGLRQVGTLAWQPPVLSREVATAMSAQVAIALARSMAMETAARLEASREGERLRTALIDSLTHELRTPLTSIRAAATTLVEGAGLDEEGRRDLAAIVDEESARLDALIGEAVEMAEIDAHVVQVHPAAHHARTLLEHAAEKSAVALKRHQVAIAVEDADATVWFDAHLLGRVLRHLVENAARYSPAGSRIVLRSRKAGGRLEFEVEDNGPGIDAVDLPLIFEKFYRGRKSTGKGKGTGMGLAIARAIVQAHGGSIEADSAPGRGTRMRFWVPLVERATDLKDNGKS